MPLLIWTTTRIWQEEKQDTREQTEGTDFRLFLSIQTSKEKEKERRVERNGSSSWTCVSYFVQNLLPPPPLPSFLSFLSLHDPSFLLHHLQLEVDLLKHTSLTLILNSWRGKKRGKNTERLKAGKDELLEKQSPPEKSVSVSSVCISSSAYEKVERHACLRSFSLHGVSQSRPKLKKQQQEQEKKEKVNNKKRDGNRHRCLC